MRFRTSSACLFTFLALGCAGSALDPATDDLLYSGMPRRCCDPDLSRVTAQLRQEGGAFVQLTAEPTQRGLEVLRRVGLRAPPDYPDIVTFDSLKIRTVWGFVGPGRVDPVAAVLFVTRIEPSADRDGISQQ